MCSSLRLLHPRAGLNYYISEIHNSSHGHHTEGHSQMKYTMFPIHNLVLQFLVSSVLGSIFVFVRARASALAHGIGAQGVSPRMRAVQGAGGSHPYPCDEFVVPIPAFFFRFQLDVLSSSPWAATCGFDWSRARRLGPAQRGGSWGRTPTVGR